LCSAIIKSIKSDLASCHAARNEVLSESKTTVNSLAEASSITVGNRSLSLLRPELEPSCFEATGSFCEAEPFKDQISQQSQPIPLTTSSQISAEISDKHASGLLRTQSSDRIGTDSLAKDTMNGILSSDPAVSNAQTPLMNAPRRKTPATIASPADSITHLATSLAPSSSHQYIRMPIHGTCLEEERYKKEASFHSRSQHQSHLLELLSHHSERDIASSKIGNNEQDLRLQEAAWLVNQKLGKANYVAEEEDESQTDHDVLAEVLDEVDEAASIGEDVLSTNLASVDLLLSLGHINKTNGQDERITDDGPSLQLSPSQPTLSSLNEDFNHFVHQVEEATPGTPVASLASLPPDSK
ncbi:unnamed protein product, partial [Protopolystoma xenopodis]